MAKVALINPQIVTSSFLAPFETTDDISIRHSLAQLAPILRARGHETPLVDLRMLPSWEGYEDAIRRLQPDWLLITAHTCEREAAADCIRRARAVAPKVRVIVGGIDPTMLPEIYREAGADHVLRGEGEVTLPLLLEDPGAFPAVLYGETPDLDRLPFEDRELWPDYKERIRRPVLGFTAPLPVIDLIAQRGCPWQCAFCCGPGEQNLYTKSRTDGKRSFSFRVRDAEHVCDEMEQLAKRYRFRSMIFHDDQFIVRPKWVESFCASVRRRFPRQRFPFWAAVRADVICR